MYSQTQQSLLPKSINTTKQEQEAESNFHKNKLSASVLDFCG